MRVSRPNRADAGHLATLIHELCAPYTHKQMRRVGWRHKNRTGAVYREHKTRHPGLLVQLRTAITDRPQADLTRTVKSASTDPAALPHFDIEAFDRLQLIISEVEEWWRDFGVHNGVHDANLEDSIRQFAHRAAGLTGPELAGLVKALRRWHAWCQVIGGWRGAPLRPNCPCPRCGAGSTGERKGLRVRMAAATGTGGIVGDAAVLAAVCLSCNATWDGRTIGILAEHIRRARAEAAEQAEAEAADQAKETAESESVSS